MKEEKESLKPVILYVDDDPENLESFRAVFRRDYAVHLAGSAAEGLEIINREKIHVLITDQRMPEMTGTELLEAVAEKHPDIVRLMLTGYGDLPPIVTAVNRGHLQGYFSKPLDVPLLRGHIEKCLCSFYLKKENERLLRALQESEAKFRGVFEDSGIGMFLTDVRGHCVDVNQAMTRIFGYTGYEFRSMDFPEGAVPISIPKETDLIGKLRKNPRRSVSFERRCIRKEGGSIWGLVTFSAIQDRDEAIRYLLGQVQDISEQKEKEKELRIAKEAAESASRSKSRFLSNMSHELRTPLNAILGFSRRLGTDSEIPPEQRRELEIIRRSGEHLLSMINDILDIAKSSRGGMGTETADFDLEELLVGIGNTVRLSAEKKDLRFTVMRSRNLPRHIRGDRDRLRRVLLRLLDNAVKFTDQGGVELRVDAEAGEREATDFPDRLRFEVRDTGAGIPPEEADAVFEPFSGTNGEETYNGGAGLGLAVSRHLVRLMGGRLDVRSNVGAGSVFSFQIPVLPADKKGRPEHTEAGLLNLSGGVEPTALTPEALKALPGEMLSELEETVVLGSSDEIEDFIGNIRPHDAALAECLTALAADFEYGRILEMVKKVREKKPDGAGKE